MIKVLSIFLLIQSSSHGAVVPLQEKNAPSPESAQSMLSSLLTSFSGESTQPKQDPGYEAKAATGPAEKAYGDGFDSSYSDTRLVSIVPAQTTQAPYAKSGTGSSPAVNCREFVYSRATTQSACIAVSQRDIVAGIIASSSDTGYCRWDSPVSVCWCPRPQNLCNDLKQCYWNKDPSLTGNAPVYSNGQSRSSSGECISNAERFYVILSNLLLKRGKKDFAIRINYSSAPAKGQLPMGPYGPAIIGGGGSRQNSYPNSYALSSYPQQAVYGQIPAYSQQISYLQAPQSVYTQQAYTPQTQYLQPNPYQPQPIPYPSLPYPQTMPYQK